MGNVKKFFVVAPILVLSLFLLPQVARADTYAINLNACSGGCGSGTLATVEITQNGANQVKFVVTFTSPNSRFIKTGAGDDVNFAFNANGNPNLSLISFSSGAPNPALTLANAGAPGTPFTNANFGTFQYAILCGACGNGAAGGFAGPLTFVVGATGITPGTFAKASSGGASAGNQFFALDMLSGTTGNTGIAAGGPLIPTPEPVSLISMGLGLLVGLGMVARKARR